MSLVGVLPSNVIYLLSVILIKYKLITKKWKYSAWSYQRHLLSLCATLKLIGIPVEYSHLKMHIFAHDIIVGSFGITVDFYYGPLLRMFKRNIAARSF